MMAARVLPAKASRGAKPETLVFAQPLAAAPSGFEGNTFARKHLHCEKLATRATWQPVARGLLMSGPTKSVGDKRAAGNFDERPRRDQWTTSAPLYIPIPHWNVNVRAVSVGTSIATD